MPGKPEKSIPYFGSKLMFIVSLLIIFIGAWFFSKFTSSITTIYSLIYSGILIISVLSSICFIVLVISKLVQHEIENYYKLRIEEEK